MTTRIFTATQPGPVTLRLPHGSARVVVDPVLKLAEVRLITEDADGPSAKAIRDATADDRGGLDVTVPDSGGGGGTMTVVTNGRSVSVSGNSGVIVTGGMTAPMPSPIVASLRVPPGTLLTFRSTSAALTVSGALDALVVATTSGDVEVGMVGTLAGNSVSGDIEVTGITGTVSLGTVSGDVEIGSYSGRHASFSTVSGDIALAATPAASGPLQANTNSGDIRLRGTSGNAALQVSTSTVSGKVRR